jgi:AP-1 complex subunit gamma-1
MSNSDVQPGTTETQQMRVMAPPGVRIHLLFDIEIIF